MEDIYGPLEGSVLYQQQNHRSRNVIDGKYGGIDGTLVCRHRRPGFYAQESSRFHLEIHPRVIMYLYEMGFYGMYRAAEMDVDRHLITALVERWRPETHTFHLPVGEATVTLEDVAILWGLPIRGRAVSGADLDSIDWVEACQRFLGFTPSNMKGWAVKLTDIRSYMTNNPIGDDSSDQAVLIWARCAIMLLMGSLMWPDSSGNLISLIYLVHHGGSVTESNYQIHYDVAPYGVISLPRNSSYSYFVDLLFSYLNLHRELYTIKISASCLISRDPPMEKLVQISNDRELGYFTDPSRRLECVPIFVQSEYVNEMCNYVSMLSQEELPVLTEITQGLTTMGINDCGETSASQHINLNVPYEPAVDYNAQYDEEPLQQHDIYLDPTATSTSYFNQFESTNEEEFVLPEGPCSPNTNFADPTANSCRDEELGNSEGEMHDDDETDPSEEGDVEVVHEAEEDFIRGMYSGLAETSSPHIPNEPDMPTYNNIQTSETGTSCSIRNVSPYLLNMFPEVAPNSIDIPTNLAGMVYDINTGVLAVGMAFKDKAHVIAGIKDHSIRWSKREYTVTESRPYTWNIACMDQNCPWRLRASVKQGKGYWKITKLSPTHYCLPMQQTNDHANLCAAFVASLILPFVRTDYGYEVSNVQTQVHSTYGINISYSKAWQGLKKARAIEFGTWDTSVKKLPRFMEAIKKWNPGTVVEWLHNPNFRSAEPNTYMVRHVFWSFKPCISAFPHMRPVISVDGTHLYTKYRHKLLLAVGIDGNQNVLPLAYALVDEETETAWRFFLFHLAKHFSLPSRRICIVSDRHRAIISAISLTPEFNEPLGCHRYCLRHICSNFYKAIHDQSLKDLCWQAGDAMDKATYNRIMRQITVQDQDAIKWFDNLQPEMWTVSHDDGMRCGMTTTNISECFNGVLKNVRRLPIIPIVEATMNRTAQYFVDRQKSGLQSKTVAHHWTDYAWKILETNLKNCGLHTARLFDHGDYRAEILTQNPGSRVRSRKHIVCLNDTTCTCGFWQRHGIPCSHVMQAARSFKISISNYVAWYYELDHYLATYEGGFFPIWDEEYWPEASFHLINTNEERPRRPGVRRGNAGRDRTTRFPMEMDRSQTRARSQAARRRGRQ